MKTIKELQDIYVSIEQEIARLWPNAFSEACKNCTDICCRPHMAHEVLESVWLRDISVRAHGKWWQQSSNPKCNALGNTGCVLTAGKPPFCIHFYCDKLLAKENPYELVANLFLSGILTALCKLDAKQNLLELDEESLLQNSHLIQQRLHDAQGSLALYRLFLNTEKWNQPTIAFQMLVEMPSILTTSVRRKLKSFSLSMRQC